LIEVMGALLLLGIITGLTVELLRAANNGRQAAERRVWALTEAQNTLERVRGLSWESLDEQKLTSLKLDEATAARLPSGRLNVAVKEVEGPPAAKRVTVTLLWKTHGGTDESPVRLTTWIYRTKGDRS
jgi:hypothetical protein